MKRFFVMAAAVLLAYAAYSRHPAFSVSTSAYADQAEAASASTQSPSGQVSGAGTVIKILPDDNDGSRHQRFILRLPSGKTLLVAHNIDIAPRVSPLSEGDIVEYEGEYVWNEKGGVVHWTHHDPSGRHPAGWLKHAGQTFQ